MQLSKTAIEEFKKIYLSEFKEKIPDSKANELGLKLLELFRVVYRPQVIASKKLVHK